MNKKILTTSIVLLFIGLALAPSIHANINKESELVEITTEVCGLPGQKPQTVQLSKCDAEAVDRLFDKIKLKLDNAETREEAAKIFNDAIVELDKYGLLGRLSVKQAQKLVTGVYQHPRMKLLEKIYDSYCRTLDDNQNFLCLIMGESDNSLLFGLQTIIRGITTFIVLYGIHIYLPIIFPFLIPLLEQLLGIKWYDNDFWDYLLVYLTFMRPILIAVPISYGSAVYDSYSGYHLYDVPAHGWVDTFGLNGRITWDGSFYGQIYETFFSSVLLYTSRYIGTSGFTGLNIIGQNSMFFIGSALMVKLGPEPP